MAQTQIFSLTSINPHNDRESLQSSQSRAVFHTKHRPNTSGEIATLQKAILDSARSKQQESLKRGNFVVQQVEQDRLKHFQHKIRQHTDKLAQDKGKMDQSPRSNKAWMMVGVPQPPNEDQSTTKPFSPRSFRPYKQPVISEITKQDSSNEASLPKQKQSPRHLNHKIKNSTQLPRLNSSRSISTRGSTQNSVKTGEYEYFHKHAPQIAHNAEIWQVQEDSDEETSHEIVKDHMDQINQNSAYSMLADQFHDLRAVSRQTTESEVSTILMKFAKQSISSA